MSSRKSDSRFQRGLRTLHTLRHLKPHQAVYFILRRGLGQRRIAAWDGPIESRQLIAPSYPPIAHGNTTAIHYEFTFLNQTLRFTRKQMNWNPSEASRLWRYHLHYFDFLRDPHRTLEEKSALIDSWILQNPQGQEPAWEPYTASLRIVNWCLFFLSVPRELLNPSWLHSLYTQARWLEKNLEWHILANHYFENIKAMLFAGFFFADNNSARWLAVFQRELTDQLAEQMLKDGGHYERSPHYHCIILQDCMELYALHIANPQLITTETASLLTSAIQSGFEFLQALHTPDGDIPLFNDSVSLSPATLDQLQRRAKDLGISIDQQYQNLIDRPDSGYFGYKNADDYFLIDCGDIGPSYQPGHTHCDFLSYVLMADKQWLIVDTGVYEYQPGAMRHYVRSTAAHNTVSVDNCEQTEIWAEFRVGRRASREFAQIQQTPTEIEFNGAFKGFATIDGGIRHERQALLQLNATGAISMLRVEDRISGSGTHQLVSRIHLHPDISAVACENSVTLHRNAQLIATFVCSDEAAATITTGWFCPEFGKKLPNQVIELACTAVLPHTMGYQIILHR